MHMMAIVALQHHPVQMQGQDAVIPGTRAYVTRRMASLRLVTDRINIMVWATAQKHVEKDMGEGVQTKPCEKISGSMWTI